MVWDEGRGEVGGQMVACTHEGNGVVFGHGMGMGIACPLALRRGGMGLGLLTSEG